MLAADASPVFVKLWHLFALGAFALASFLALAVLFLGGFVGQPATPESGWVSASAQPLSAAQGARISAQIKLSFAASTRAAKADVRRAIPVINAYGADHKRSYLGATVDRLRLDYDRRLAPEIAVIFATGSYYCLQATVNGITASYTGPSFGRKIVVHPCDPTTA
jgi:hypothetical protein